MSMDTLTIASTYCGPPEMGNGGYMCGMVASRLGSPRARIRLSAPIPLERPLQVEARSDGVLAIVDPQGKGRDGGPLTVAEGSALAPGDSPQNPSENPSENIVDVPEAPSFAQAEAAMENYAGFSRHPYPTCFVCGPKREVGSGLRIFPGPVEGRELVASTWVPEPPFVEPDGLVDPVLLWSLLDCPGGFAAILSKMRMMVLGQLTGQIDSRPRAGQRCVAMGWPIGSDGRKHFVGTAIVGESGEVFARGHSVWIELKKPAS